MLASHVFSALLCLLTIALTVPASAWGGTRTAGVSGAGHPADVSHAAAPNPTGPPGGASRAAARSLLSHVSYRSQVAPGQQAWYKLESGAGARVRIQLWGRTRSCPVRMTLLDAHRLGLGEIASSTREIEPFIVYTPENDTSMEYYVRVQQDPSAGPCASAAYVFTLQEPEVEQPTCEATKGPNGEPVSYCVSPGKEEAVPTYEARACAAASRGYRQLESELARTRNSGTRRRLLVEIGAARRAVTHGCRY